MATLEANLETMFQAAVTMEDEEPLWVLQAWGMVFETATVLEHVRAIERGEEGAPPGAFEAAQERLLQRWQRLEPDSGRPELFRLLRIQDPAEKRAAVLDLSERYPNDFLIVQQVLMQNDDSERESSVQTLEDYLSRSPQDSRAYACLVQLSRHNQTLQAEYFVRWQEAAPGHPQLVVEWLSANQHRQDPDATTRILADFFARRGKSERDLAACQSVLRLELASHVAEAEACLDRIASDAEADEATSTQALKAAAARAAKAGDWTPLLAAVESLEPEEGARALLAAARELEAPGRCDDSLHLARSAREIQTGNDDTDRSIASVLKRCEQHPGSRDYFVTLLSTASEESVPQILGAWAMRVNGVWKGDVPATARGVIERRLEASPGSVPLLRTLDTLYQLRDPNARRGELLQRWQRLPDPTSYFGADQTLALASSYLLEGKVDSATEVLRWQLKRRFQFEVVEGLWELLQSYGEAGAAERLVDDLINDSNQGRRSAGYVLRARSALLDGGFAAAVNDYWKAWEEQANRDFGEELATVVAIYGDHDQLDSVAGRLCAQPAFARGTSTETCALRLLSRIGADEAAAARVRSAAGSLPDDLESLRALAYSAQGVEDFETAERAFLRAFEIDPKAEASWTQLGSLYEKQGRVDDLLNLLDRSRRELASPSLGLYRAAGRATTAAGRGREAVELLQEARSLTPEGQAGNWSRGWIDQELRAAYTALGSSLRSPSETAKVTAVDLPSLPKGWEQLSSQELLARAQAFYSGSGGRYDPALAVTLFEELAARGDRRAEMRLAIVFVLGPEDLRRGSDEARKRYQSAIEAVREGARSGDAFSQYLLGTVLQTGNFGEVDLEASRSWLQRAAEQGNGWAWNNLGWLAESGSLGDRPDSTHALDGYRRASELGLAPSMLSFARVAWSLPRDRATCEEAGQWLEKARELGHPAAASTLNRHRFYGVPECLPRQPQVALKALLAAKEREQDSPSLELGLALLELGQDRATIQSGLTEIEAVAIAEQNSFAYEVLALLRFSGVKVDQDTELGYRDLANAARLGSDGFPGLRSVRWGETWEFWPAFLQRIQGRLEANYENGDAASAALLARMGHVGLAGIDDEQVLLMARFAAERGEGLAMRTLYHVYRQGAGVEENPAEAMEWLRRGAQAGDSFCQMFYGNALIQGERLPRDLEEGVAWLTRSAEAGNWWAVGDMAHLHSEGWGGLPVSLDKAAPWWRKLAERGDAEAVGRLRYREVAED